MEQKQFDYGVEIMQPWIISSSTKGQLFETLETEVTLLCIGECHVKIMQGGKNITTLFTVYKVGNNLMFLSKGADAILIWFLNQYIKI